MNILKKVVFVLLYLTPFYWCWWVVRRIYQHKNGKKVARRQGVRFPKRIPKRVYVMRKVTNVPKGIQEFKDQLEQVCAAVDEQKNRSIAQSEASADYLRRLSNEVTSQLDRNGGYMASVVEEVGTVMEDIAARFKEQVNNVNELVCSMVDSKRNEHVVQQVKEGEWQVPKEEKKRVAASERKKKSKGSQ